jgi:rRNA pseudouridine-1189 N-methylase Emg1 (Nep1/Mra1 family)
LNFRKIVIYVVRHPRKVQKFMCLLNKLWHKDKHRQIGTLTAKIVKDIIDYDEASDVAADMSASDEMASVTPTEAL